MALIERLLKLETGTIGKHAFQALLGEWERGKITRDEIINAWRGPNNEPLPLDAAAQAELDAIFAKMQGTYDSVALGGFVTLANVGAAYDAINASKGLGAVELQVGGIEWFRFGVKVSKVGTGTQSWQLWNETNGVEVAVIDDAGAAGDKTLSVTVTPATPYAPDIKLLRVRAKSTVAIDDPLYYGSSILFRRRARLTNLELHDILLAADAGIAYHTPAALRTRLGI